MERLEINDEEERLEVNEEERLEVNEEGRGWRLMKFWRGWSLMKKNKGRVPGLLLWGVAGVCRLLRRVLRRRRRAVLLPGLFAVKI